MKFRMQWTAIFTIMIMAAVLILRPEQVFLAMWKLSLVSMAGWLGYWLDRELFPYARPHKATAKDQSFHMLRRAIVVGAAMLSAGLAV